MYVVLQQLCTLFTEVYTGFVLSRTFCTVLHWFKTSFALFYIALCDLCDFMPVLHCFTGFYTILVLFYAAFTLFYSCPSRFHIIVLHRFTCFYTILVLFYTAFALSYTGFARVHARFPPFYIDFARLNTKFAPLLHRTPPFPRRAHGRASL